MYEYRPSFNPLTEKKQILRSTLEIDGDSMGKLPDQLLQFLNQQAKKTFRGSRFRATPWSIRQPSNPRQETVYRVKSHEMQTAMVASSVHHWENTANKIQKEIHQRVISIAVVSGIRWTETESAGAHRHHLSSIRVSLIPAMIGGAKAQGARLPVD